MSVYLTGSKAPEKSKHGLGSITSNLLLCYLATNRDIMYSYHMATPALICIQDRYDRLPIFPKRHRPELSQGLSCRPKSALDQSTTGI